MRTKKWIIAGVIGILIISVILAAGCTSTSSSSTTQTPVTTSVSVDTGILGTWTTTEWDDGYLETKTLTINQDGTGTYKKEEKGEIKLKSFVWNEMSNGCYIFTFSDGDTDTYVYSNGILSHDHDIYTRE